VAVGEEVAAVVAITGGAGRALAAVVGTTPDQDPGPDPDRGPGPDQGLGPEHGRALARGNGTRRVVPATSGLGSATPIPRAVPAAARTGDEAAPVPTPVERVASRRRPLHRQRRQWGAIV